MDYSFCHPGKCKWWLLGIGSSAHHRCCINVRKLPPRTPLAIVPMGFLNVCLVYKCAISLTRHQPAVRKPKLMGVFVKE